MRIGEHTIGGNHPAYIIAEIGANHDGSLDQARSLIQAASEAGADAAKFQFYRAKKLYPGKVTPFAVPDKWLPILKQTCEDESIDFLCSVFCQQTLKVYRRVHPVAVKIASPEATNEQLIKAAIKTGLPLIISTGAMAQPQVDVLSWWLGGMGIFQGVALLHCVSAYPADPDELNLRAIREMQSRYEPRLSAQFSAVGFSDHTSEIDVPALAVAAGACVIEKHLTLDRSWTGPDHSFALEPDDFTSMVRNVRSVETMLGDGVKRVQPSEDPTDRRAA